MELLVVTAIIGLVLAITIPAVQAAREVSRRLKCQNNLRQVGLACQAHEATTHFYPPGFVLKPHSHNFVQFLLPYIEQGSVSVIYDFNSDWDSTRNAAAIRHNLRLFVCPSTPATREFISDYAVAEQIHRDTIAMLARQKLFQKQRSDYLGFLAGSRQRTAEATDGLSNTILLCEDAGRPTRYTFGRFKGDKDLTGAKWATPDGRFDINMLCNGRKFRAGAQMMNCTNNNEIYSFHPNGVDFAFIDGSVRFIEQSIEPDTFISLITAKAGD